MARIKTRPDEDFTPENRSTLDLTPNVEWRSRVRDFTPMIGEVGQAKLDHLRDIVYGLVLRTGAKDTQVAKLFGFQPSIVRTHLGPVIEMAQTELALALQGKQIDTALNSKLPIAHIWAGKQFAGQTDAPAAATTGDDGSVEVRINVVRKGDDVASDEAAPSGEGAAV